VALAPVFPACQPVGDRDAFCSWRSSSMPASFSAAGTAGYAGRCAGGGRGGRPRAAIAYELVWCDAREGVLRGEVVACVFGTGCAEVRVTGISGGWRCAAVFFALVARVCAPSVLRRSRALLRLTGSLLP